MMSSKMLGRVLIVTLLVRNFAVSQETAKTTNVYTDTKNGYFMFLPPKGWTPQEYSDLRTKVGFNNPHASGVFIRFIVREAPGETFEAMIGEDNQSANQMRSRGISCEVKEINTNGLKCSEVRAQFPNDAGTTMLRKFLSCGLHFNIQYSAPTKALFDKYLDEAIKSLQTITILKVSGVDIEKAKEQQIANRVRLAKLTVEWLSVEEAMQILKEAQREFPDSKLIQDALKETAIGVATDSSVIPDNFIGSWIEKGDDANVINELKVEGNTIEWTRQNEGKDIVTKYNIDENGGVVSFDSKVTYSRAVFGGQSYKGDVKVKMKVKDDTLIVEIGDMKVQEQGFTVTMPGDQHVYRKQPTEGSLQAQNADCVLLRSGRKILGRILNDSFTIKQRSTKVERPDPNSPGSRQALVIPGSGVVAIPRGDARIIESRRDETITLKWNKWQIRSVTFDAEGADMDAMVMASGATLVGKVEIDKLILRLLSGEDVDIEGKNLKELIMAKESKDLGTDNPTFERMVRERDFVVVHLVVPSLKSYSFDSNSEVRLLSEDQKTVTYSGVLVHKRGLPGTVEKHKDGSVTMSFYAGPDGTLQGGTGPMIGPTAGQDTTNLANPAGPINVDTGGNTILISCAQSVRLMVEPKGWFAFGLVPLDLKYRALTPTYFDKEGMLHLALFFEKIGEGKYSSIKFLGKTIPLKRATQQETTASTAETTKQAEVQSLINTLQAGDGRQRYAAILALASMGKDALPSVESLIQLLSDDTQIEVQLSGEPAVTTNSGWSVRGPGSVWGFRTINEEALRALKKITAQEIGLDQAAWKEWLHKVRN